MQDRCICMYVLWRWSLYLDELRWTKPSDPHEASLSGSLPSTRNDMKNIRFSNNALQIQQIIDTRNAIVYINAQLVFWQVIVNRCLKLTHLTVVVLEPPCILHVKNCGIYKLFVTNKEQVINNTYNRENLVER